MTGRGPTEARVVGNFGLQALQELVDQKVLLQMAKEAGVVPKEEEIDAEIKLQAALQPGYIDLLHSQGMDDKSIRQDLKVTSRAATPHHAGRDARAG